MVFCNTMPKGILALRSFMHNAKGDTDPKVFYTHCQRGYRPIGLSHTMPKEIPAQKSFTYNAKGETNLKVFHTHCQRSFTLNAKGNTGFKVFHTLCQRGYQPKCLSRTMPKRSLLHTLPPHAIIIDFLFFFY